ncbi:MAG: hypothetical protein K0S79_163 [Nitrospira sp.]|jgi:hypothetical protein|nr:hypothetical protein [Nitrospira sp.]
MKNFVALALTAEVLALASPLLAGLVGIPDPDVGMTFAQAWFYALPTLVDGWLLPEPENMLGVAAGVYLVQYFAVISLFAGSSHLAQRFFERKAIQSRLREGRGKSFEIAAEQYHSNDGW